MAMLNQQQAEDLIYMHLQAIAHVLDMYEEYHKANKPYLCMTINEKAMYAYMFNPESKGIHDTYLIDIYSKFEEEYEPDEDLSDQPDG